MNRYQRLLVAIAGSLLWVACASSDDPALQGQGHDDPRDPEQTVPRPEGWSEDSHGRGAEADYSRLFADNTVQRIDLTMSGEARQSMLDDMQSLVGEFGQGSFMGRGMPDSKACEGRAAGDACQLGGGMGDGTCRSFNAAQAFCLPNDLVLPAGGPGGRPMGPIDLIPGDPAYVPVAIEYDGRRWEHVGIRYKGNSSLRGGWSAGQLKLGFRLSFDHYETEQAASTDQRFFGFSEMTFSSAFNDPTLIRDKLAGEIAADFGLKTARCAFYRVYVDSGEGPEYWGLYTMIEDPSDELIEAQFDDKSGNVYKPDGPGAYFAEFDEKSFEKKTHREAADYGDVIAAIAALNAPRTDAESWRENLERRFDVDGFLKVLAFSRAIGHWDGYGVMAHNYYLYGDPSRAGQLSWISWDHNLTWQAMGGGVFADPSIMMDEVTETWPLIRYLLDDPVYRERYMDALAEVLEGAYAKDRFDARAAELHALIAPYVSGGSEGEQAPYTALSSPDAFGAALADPTLGLITAADTRRAAVARILAER